MMFSPSNHKRVFTLALFVSFFFAATSSPSVDAYKGPGYFQGGTACTTNFDWDLKCNDTFASTSQNNVVYGGSGVNALAGVSSGNKASFITWLTNRYNSSIVVNRGNSVPDTATVQNRLGAQFIIATMLGSSAQRNNLAEVVKRVNNPNISMTTMNGIPENYGPISFSGRKALTSGGGSAGDRDPFFNTDSYSPGVSKLLLVFTDTSTDPDTIVYILEYSCANPIGKLPGLPPVPVTWTMSGHTEVTSATATRGQSVTFRHYVKNDGPDTSTSISASTIVSGGAGTVKAYHNVGTFTSGQQKNTDTDTFTIPLTAAVGAMYCQYPRYLPRSDSAAGYENGANACVTVVRAYTLTPHVTTPSTVAKQGEEVTFSYSVENPAPGTSTNPTTHVPRAIIIPPAVLPPAGFFAQKDSIAGCPTYTAMAPGITCVNAIAPSVSNYPASIATTPAGSEDVTLSYPIGTRVCRTFSVYPRDASGNVARNRDSVLSCVLVAASPYLTIVGGSLWAGGSTISPYTGAAKVTAAAPSSFGSFGDYGIFSTGEINYFGSAGQPGKVSSTSGMTSGTWLTFANEDPASLPHLGSYASTHEITDISAVPTGAIPVSGSMIVPGTGVYGTNSSDITITASNMAPGTHVSIYAPNNTVTIDGNITYNTSGVSSFAQLPSLTIAARRIRISGTVTEIAGNFYASSSFVTCYQGPETPGSSPAITSIPGAACNHRLDIHGAVTVANQAVNSLVFNRSYGGTTDGEPAEVIQMRPEVFLTAYDLSAKSASVTVTTVQETELPPRY